MTQKEALDILKTGANVFITGAAGSGKTHLLREYISYLKDHGVATGITASTGIAATHMNGITIHSWMGMGVMSEMSDDDIERIAHKKHLQSRLRGVSVLVIDEISMLHHYRLDFVDRILRLMKANSLPFGGVQVVLCGDFFQLPPVRSMDEPEGKFAYHSDGWEKLDLQICYLDEQHRQEDGNYLSILNAIRDDAVTPDLRELLHTRIGKKPGIAEPTRLYTHNADVDFENMKELAKLPGPEREFRMTEEGPEKLVAVLKKSCLSPEILKLKKGARVMFTKNDYENGFVNGTLGTVEECNVYSIVVKTWNGKMIQVPRAAWRIEEDGKVKAEIIQYPLRLAWAITVHKSQGMSLDAAEVDLSAAFERGMGYVALSRLRSLEGLFLTGINEMAFKVHDEVLHFDGLFRKESAECAERFTAMPKAKIKELHDAFLTKVGGVKGKKEKADTVALTKELCAQGLSLKEIASKRGLKEATILDHLKKITGEDPFFDISHLKRDIAPEKLDAIIAAFRKIGPREDGFYASSPVKAMLGEDYSYDEIHFARLFL